MDRITTTWRKAIVLVPKPRNTAPLWVHFGFRPNDIRESGNGKEAICKIFCNKSGSHSANATNLKRLQTHHQTQQYAKLFLDV